MAESLPKATSSNVMLDQPVSKMNSSTHTQAFLSRSQSEASAASSSALDYEKLLQKIPGFEKYGRHGESDLTGNTGVATLEGTHQRRGGQLVGPRNSEAHLSAYKAVLSNDHTLLDVLPNLKWVSKERQNITQMQVQVSNYYRGIRNMYDTLGAHINSSLELIQGAYRSLGSLGQIWQKDLDSMRILQQEIAAAQEILDPLEIELINAQWDVKEVEDEFFALFAGGAHPGESDASREDRQMGLLGRQEDIDDLFSTDEEGQFLEAPESPNERQQAGLPQYGLESETAHSILDPTLVHDSIRTRTLVGAHVNGSSSLWDIESRTNEQRNRRKIVPGRPVGGWFAAESIGVGMLLEDLARPTTARILDSRRDPQLVSTKEMVQFRHEDFKVALGGDLDMVGKLVTSRNQREQPQAAHSQFTAVGLSNIKVPIIRQNAYIAFWGREMSQNSILEAWRTNHYGGKILGELIKHGKIGPLHQYVQNVRRIEARFDSDWGPDTLMLAKAGPRSISVQAPGSVRTFGDSSGQKSEIDLQRLHHLNRSGRIL